MRGFALVTVSPGKESEFFGEVRSVSCVRGVFYVFEEHAFLVEVNVENAEDLQRALAEEIRQLPGVKKTATFLEGESGSVPPVFREGMKPKDVASVFYWIARAKSEFKEAR